MTRRKRRNHSSSFKAPAEIEAALLAGARHVTFPRQVLEQLICNKLSAAAIYQFETEGRGLLS